MMLLLVCEKKDYVKKKTLVFCQVLYYNNVLALVFARSKMGEAFLTIFEIIL
jgi:hypothetical protein